MSKKSIGIIFLVGIWIVSCAPHADTRNALFPPPDFVKGWRWEGEPFHYTPENLYDYIDGEAELYLTYDFQELATLTYVWKNSEDTSLVVDIYNMGTPLNAFGLYSNYQHPSYQYGPIGTDAIVSDFGLKFYQGPYVVELKTSGYWEKNGKVIQTIAEEISKRIGIPAESPDILALLPTEGQMDKTLRYIARDMLNQSFLSKGLEARYRIGDQEATGFLVLFPSGEEAKNGFEKLKEFFIQSEGPVTIVDNLGEASFSIPTSYHGYTVVSRSDRFLAGAQDLSSFEIGTELVLKILDRVKCVAKKVSDSHGTAFL